MKGKILIETLGSVVLKGNPLGDPRLRKVPVYLPPSYMSDPRRRYPTIYFLPGFTGTGQGAVAEHPFKENVAERLDRLIAEREAPECLLVVPDCFTRYGGSQYLDSEGTGRYAEHVLSELIPYVDSKFRTIPAVASRAVMGKSSGGYGALSLAMASPGTFSCVACHSGDMLFELCYGQDFPKCVNALARYGGSFARFLKEFAAARDKSGFPHELVNVAGMASCYSPNPRNPLGFDLPFDERTAERAEAVWRRWKAHDPVVRVVRRAAALKGLKSLYLDCGAKDEYFLHLGARAFSRVLGRLGVGHRYEEHGGGHSGGGERYDVSLTLIGKSFRGQ